MKIVQVAPLYSPVIGGVENVVRRLAEYATAKGHETYVLTYNRLRFGGVGSLPAEESVGGIHIIRVKPNIGWSHGTYSSELPSILKTLKPDIVHVHAWRHPHVFQVAKLKQSLDFKGMLHSHAPFHSIRQLGLTAWLYHRAVDRLMKKNLYSYDYIIAITKYEREILVKKFGVREEKIKLIPNGIDDSFKEVTQYNVDLGNSVLYIGALSKLKNVPLLAKSMKFVISKVGDATLVLAGEDQGALNGLMDGIEKKIINYFGQVADSKKFEIYGSCKVFAHPASYEPFGISLLEAQSFGKPCVITGSGGQIYAAPPNETSLYAEPNPMDFGEKIVMLLTNQELYNRLSSNAKKWSLQHLWSNILPKYDELYS